MNEERSFRVVLIDDDEIVLDALSDIRLDSGVMSARADLFPPSPGRGPHHRGSV